MTSLSQSSTLLGALPPPSHTLLLKVSVPFIQYSELFSLSLAIGIDESSAVGECESSGSSSDAVVAALGSALAVVIVTAVVVQVIVIVFFMRKLQRAKGNLTMSKKRIITNTSFVQTLRMLA